MSTSVRAALAAVIVGAVVSTVVVTTPAVAEGSRDLNPTNGACTASVSGTCRANLEWRTNTYGPAGSAILRRTIFDVYLTRGEVLESGSSAMGVGQGDIIVYNPGVVTNEQAATLPTLVAGTNGYACSNQRSNGGPAGAGAITSRAQELAGPQAVSGGGNPAGYVPCSYVAPSTGIYKAIFYGPAGPNANTDGSPTGEVNLSSASNFTAAQGSSVSAWDLTVRGSTTSTTNIQGRVFTYALTAFTGGNGRPIDQALYTTTLDGYEYRVDTNGLDPNGFLIYGNERGFLDPQGNPLDHDVLGSDGTLSTLQGGTSLAPPQYPLSFHPLAADTLAALGINSTPTAPSIDNLAYRGTLPGSTSYVAEGGTFTFDQTAHGTDVIVISRDGTNFDPGNPQNRALRAVHDAGSQSITWDGLDNAGDPFPVGDNYRVHAELQAGVYHFPLIDAENSIKGGPSFTLLNPPRDTCPFGNPACTTSFYDDRGYHTTAGGADGTDVGTPGTVLCGLNPPNPPSSNSRTGYDSTSAQRKWGSAAGGNTNRSCTGSFGDAKGLDSWTYFPSNTSASSVSIVDLPPVPRANDDSQTTAVGTPVTVPASAGLLRNDTGTGITVTGHTAPTHGTVTVAPDGSYTYTPTPGYIGPDTFDYTITDAFGRTSTATVTLDVRPPPVARDDVGSTPVDTPLTGASVLANDIGPGLTVTAHTAPAHGTVTIAADGTYTYTPDPGYTGPDSFSYTATSNLGDSDTATVQLRVTPTAAGDAGTTPVNTALNGASVLGNDHGTGLAVTAHSQPAHGSLTIAADGTYVYTPTDDYTGPDSFTYTATDAAGQAVTATVALTVTPTAANDTGTTPVDTPLRGASVLANDDGRALTVTAHTAPAHGTVSIAADGTYVYTPDPGYTGPDSFTYTATDAAGQRATATVALTVTPRATDDTGTTPVNTPLAGGSVLGNDAGTGLTVTAHTAPAHGTVSIAADGTYVYTPATDYSGPDSFTYTTTDAAGQTASATVRITVTPATADDVATTAVNTALNGASVLANDHGTGLAVTAHTAPTHGSVAIAADGTYAYTPDGDYSGPDSFSYTATDDSGQTSTATVRITVTPDAADDTGTTPVNTVLNGASVLGNDRGTGLTVTANTAPAHGTVTVAADGTYVYTPATDYSGADSFTYTATDSSGRQTTATVRLTVTPGAVDDSATTKVDTALNGASVLANDHGAGLTVTGNTQPAHGTVTVAPDGSYVYVPDAGYSGPDPFRYTTTDSSGAMSSATVFVIVTPQASDDGGTTPANTALRGSSVLANDKGTGLTVDASTQPTHGTVTVAKDGTYVYTPDLDYSGPDSFIYTALDGSGQRTTSTVFLTVTPAADPDTGTTPANTALNGASVLGNDHGTGLTVTDHSAPTHGTVTVAPDGTYVYTPADDYSGPDSFTYTTTDAAGHTATATVTIRVTPAAVDDVGSTPANTPLNGASVLANDHGTALTVIGHTAPTHGTVSIAGDGSYVYTPNDDYSGPDFFTYTTTDDSGQSTTATVDITVTPGTTDDTGTTPANTPLNGASVLGNDHGTGLTVTGNTAPAHGTVTVAADGTYVYTPTDDYSGPDSFTYTTTDAAGHTATATVTLTVTPKAVDDTGTTPANTPLSGASVLGNDHGTGLTVTGNTAPTHGTVTVAADGTYVYTPTDDYSGPDSFTYTTTDAAGHTATATVTLTVTPKAVDDQGSTLVDTTLEVPASAGLLGNDLGTGLAVTDNTAPVHGTVTVQPDGSYTYVPDAGFSGTDSFTYTVTDDSGRTSTATVLLSVGLAAVNDAATTPVNTPVTLDPLANDRGAGLTLVSVTQPPASQGRVAIVDGKVVFTPAKDFTGVAHYTYTIRDSDGQTATATDTVTVTPSASPDSTRTPIDTPVTLDSVANDHGSGLRITAVVQPPASQGTVAIVGGRLVFRPARGFTGTVHFTYTVTDAHGQRATAQDTVVVEGAVAADPDRARTTQGRPVTINPLGNDPGHSSFLPSTLQLRDPATGVWRSSVTVPGQGTFVVDGTTGRVTFTPLDGFVGTTDAVRYQVLDRSGRLHLATITVVVRGAGTASGGAAGGGGLADTGTDVLGGLGGGFALLLAGLGLLLAGRRRRRG